MKIPEKPIAELTREEALTFLASCRNHSEMGVATTMLLNKERVYNLKEIQLMIEDRKTMKDNSENTAEVTFFKNK